VPTVCKGYRAPGVGIPSNWVSSVYLMLLQPHHPWSLSCLRADDCLLHASFCGGPGARAERGSFPRVCKAQTRGTSRGLRLPWQQGWPPCPPNESHRLLQAQSLSSLPPQENKFQLFGLINKISESQLMLSLL